MKKFLSMALALVMVMALSIPAFASEQTQSTEISGTTNAPTLKLTVPGTGNVFLNPYKLSYQHSTMTTASTDQVISAAQYIVNLSTMPVNVKASVTGTNNGNVVFSTAALKGTETTNSVFMYFEMLAHGSDQSEPTWATAYDKTKHVVVAAKAATAPNTVTMGASADGSTANTTDGYCAFHLAGEAATAPTTAWSTEDTVDVAVTFTFTPTAAATTT